MRLTLVLLAAATLATGCLPYTVGTTARPVPKGERVRTMSMYFLPNAVEDTTRGAAGEPRHALPLRGFDAEVRYGIDDRSDWGFRITSGSGVVLGYKRLLAPPSDRGIAVAAEGQLGYVNFGEHALVGGTIVASGPERGAAATPYGGVRVLQVAPLSPDAVHDTPTIGAFVGVRIGKRSDALVPELGIFHDRSALGLRRGSILIVPSVSASGDFLRQLRGHF